MVHRLTQAQSVCCILFFSLSPSFLSFTRNYCPSIPTVVINSTTNWGSRKLKRHRKNKTVDRGILVAV